MLDDYCHEHTPRICTTHYFYTATTDARKRLDVRLYVDCVWDVMAHVQKPDFNFRPNGRVHLNRQGRHFSRLLAAELCASAVVMLDTPSSVVVWRVMATHSIRQFSFHLPSRASPCAITFQLDSTSPVLFTSRTGDGTHNYESCDFFKLLQTCSWGLRCSGIRRRVNG